MRSLEDIFREVEKVPDYYGHAVTSVHYKNGWGARRALRVVVFGPFGAESKSATFFPDLRLMSGRLKAL
jgi:hypothetical protein